MKQLQKKYCFSDIVTAMDWYYGRNGFPENSRVSIRRVI